MNDTPSNNVARENLYGLAAEFTTTPGIYHAAEKVHAAGYKWFDCQVPFAVHGLDRAMGVKMTILPILVFLLHLSVFRLLHCRQWENLLF